MTFGNRLKIERQRVGLTQVDFAEIGGVSRATQISYEQSKGSPDVAYWQAVANIGVDVGFVLTGVRSSCEKPLNVVDALKIALEMVEGKK